MLPDIHDTEVNPYNAIWEGIVQKWATSAEILAFLAYYVESEHYESLSNHEQLSFDTFRRVVYAALRDKKPTILLYHYLEYRLADFGYQLED